MTTIATEGHKMNFKAKDTVSVLDMDGNTIAKFFGYDCPGVTEIFARIADATRVVVKNQKQETRETYFRS